MTDKQKFTLDDVFSLKSVAVVGASPENFISFSAMAIACLKEAGFPTIYPVNPKYKEAFGLPCYPSVSAIPGPVDHVLVSIPAARTLELLDDCARKGVTSVHFFTAGYRETGEASGVELEKAMLEKARSGGFRIIGPNCTGLFVPRAKYVTADRMPMTPGPVGFISQSGGHAQDMPFHAAPRGITFSKVISYGNALDINECELLEYMAADDETRIIALYIEGVREGHHFLDILRKAAKKKPVIIYKGGLSDAGLRAAQSHTASLTSSAKIFEAVCRQANAIQVNDTGEMIDILVALCFAQPYPAGKGVAVAGLGGGPSVLASDQLEQAGLRLPPISPALHQELSRFLPTAGAIFSNPLDASNILSPDIIYQTLKALGGSEDVHMLLYHMGLHPVTRWGYGIYAPEFFSKPASEAFSKAHAETGKPVFLILGPPSDPKGAEEMFKIQEVFVKAGLPVFHSMEKFALAMARILTWRGRFIQA